MTIQIFEKTVDGSSTVIACGLELFHDAGFSDVVSDGSTGGLMSGGLTSDSGVYGVKKFSMSNTKPSGLTKLYLAKDDSQKCLMLYGNNRPDSTVKEEYYFYNTIIANGKSTTASDRPRFSDSNVLNGDILAPVNTSKAKLAQFVKWTGETFEPFYVAVNLVNYQANTKVTDGVNSFTSLGNLFYIKNA